MSSRHLILGSITDFITGRKVDDTADEQVRQKIAKFLVEKKGYQKEDIDTRRKIKVTVDGNAGETKVDFIIKPGGTSFILINFAPGSIVTRERSTLAAARLVENYEIPISVITNGMDAHIMETKSGKIIAKGLDKILSKEEAFDKIAELVLGKISEIRLEKERRILYTFDVLAEKECNDFRCCKF